MIDSKVLLGAMFLGGCSSSSSPSTGTNVASDDPSEIVLSVVVVIVVNGDRVAIGFPRSCSSIDGVSVVEDEDDDK